MNNDIINLWKTLQKIEMSSGGSLAAKYSVAMNKGILKAPIEIFEKLSAPSEKFLEFQKKYLELLKILEADKEGFAPQFNEEKLELEKIYQGDLVGRQDQVKSFNNLLLETQEIELHSIPEEDVMALLHDLDPKMVTPGDFTNLMLLVK
jgi:hypothetical protein